MHTVAGGLNGGLSGALSGAATAGAAPLLNDLQTNLTDTLKKAGASDTVAKGIAQSISGVTAAGLGAAVGGVGGNAVAGAATGVNIDVNNRQLHPDERKWAKDNASKYQQYLANKTGEKITAEEAYQRLLSAGYAVVDEAAIKGGTSDETAKQFIGTTAPKGMFWASAADRANPFLSGNAEGSFTPEQQARFGSSKPGEQASLAVTKAMEYVGQPCSDCRNKVASIDNAVIKLLEAKVLYQDDLGSVNLINQQIDQLKAGITKEELVRGMAGVISDKDKGIAGLILGIPSRAVMAEATLELLERKAINQGLNSGTFTANEIRFSQNTVSFGKTDRTTSEAYTYDDLVKSMRTNGWKGDPVDVVRMPDGRLTSIDNTRIRAARAAGIDMQANVRSFD